MKNTFLLRPPPSSEHFSILKPIIKNTKYYQDNHEHEQTCPTSEKDSKNNFPHILKRSDIIEENMQTNPQREDDETILSNIPKFIDTIDAIDHLFNPLDAQKIKAIKYLEEVTNNNPSVSREIRLFGGIQRLCCLLRSPLPQMMSPLINIFINITSGEDEVMEENKSLIMDSKLNLLCFVQYLNNENLSSEIPFKIIKILTNLSFNKNSYKLLFNLVLEPFERRINMFLDLWPSGSERDKKDACTYLGLILDCFLNFLANEYFCKYSLLSRISIPSVLLEILKISPLPEDSLVVPKVFDILIKLSDDFDPEFFQPDDKNDIFNCTNIKRRKKLKFGQNPQAIFWLSDVHDTFSLIMTKNSPQSNVSSIIKIYNNLTSKNTAFHVFYRQQIRSNDGLLIVLSFLESKCKDIIIKTLRLLSILVEDEANKDVVCFCGVKYFINCLNDVIENEMNAESEEIVDLVINLFKKKLFNQNIQAEKNFIQRGGIRALVELGKNKKFSRKINKILTRFWKNKHLKEEAVKSGLSLDGKNEKKSKNDDFITQQTIYENIFRNNIDLEYNKF